MMFVAYPDPRLSQKAEPVRPLTPEILAIGDRLLQAARASKAYGLAGAHIGEVVPVVVLNVSPDVAEPEYLVLYNPRVNAVSPELQAGPEASVSLPGIQVSIERPVWADIAFEDFKGQPRTLQFEGFVARCALHEIDQVNGIFFLSCLSKLKRDMALKKYSRFEPVAAPLG
jgi:peptide deformylase